MIEFILSSGGTFFAKKSSKQGENEGIGFGIYHFEVLSKTAKIGVEGYEPTPIFAVFESTL